jgi:hypothetical protein
MEKQNRKIKVTSKSRKQTDTAAGDEKKISGGHYYCDYSPRYSEDYDIYEKAKKHAREMRHRLKEDRTRNGQ